MATAQKHDNIDNLFQKALLLLTWGLLIFALFLVLDRFYSLMMLLLACIIITYILLGPVNILERLFKRVLSQYQKGCRLLAVTLVYLVFFLTVILSSVSLGPLLIQQISDFSKAVPNYLNQVEEKIVALQKSPSLATLFAPNQADDKEPSAPALDDPSAKETVSDDKSEPLELPVLVTQDEKEIFRESILKEFLTKGLNMVENQIIGGIQYLSLAFTQTISGFLYGIAALVLIFYFLLDGHRLPQIINRTLSKGAAETLNNFLSSAHTVMSTFIKGQFLLGLLTGAYMFVVYSIFDVDFAILLASFFAISEILPVVGTWIGITPGFIVILFTQDIGTLFAVWLCSYAFQTIKDNILAPKVVGDVMGLHPVVVIFSLLIGVKLAGLMGILIALPLASILTIIVNQHHKDNGATSDQNTPITEGYLS